MSPRWLISLATVFVLLTIVANSIDSAAAMNSTDMTVLAKLMSYSTTTFVDPLGGSNFIMAIKADLESIWGIISNTVDALWSMLWFNYNFLNNGGLLGSIVKYAFFWPISIGMLFTLFTTLRQTIQR